MILGKALMMAAVGGMPKFLGYTAAVVPGASTTIVVNRPSGVQDGDLMIAVMVTPGFRTTTGPAGWSKVLTQETSTVMDAFTKTASSEPADYTFTLSAAANPAIQILAFRNAAFDVVGSLGTITGTGDITIPAITSDGGLVVAAVGGISSSSGSTTSTPSGMTLIHIETQDGSTYTKMATFLQKVSSGSTGTRTSTIGVNNIYSAGVLIGVKRA